MCGIGYANDMYETYYKLIANSRMNILVGNLKRSFIRNSSIFSWTGSIQLWSIADGRLIKAIPFSEKEYSYSIDVNATGDLLVASIAYVPKGGKYEHYAIACYSLTEKRWLWRNDWKRDDAGKTVKFSPDGRKILVVGNKNIYIFGTNGNEIERIAEPLKDYPVLRLAFVGYALSPSCRYFVIWQEKPPPGHSIPARWFVSKWITMWDLETRRQIARWEKPRYESHAAAFTEDEKNVLFGTGGHIDIWSVERQKKIRELLVSDFGSINYLKFSDDYRYLGIFGVGKDFHVVVCEYPGGRIVRDFRNMEGGYGMGGLYPMTFFKGGDFFAFAERGRVCLYNTQTWEEKWCFPPK
jgi:WD40 repeat protein